ncbi:FAD-binding protein [Amycolatopsis sp. NPDC051371]|uniref:FAD-binding protein n=1 Tax=Amycolatopsis sp. NPDC051371 TaxID=3155800 RepID=UPI00342A73B1
MTETTKTDLLVVGGGMAGMAAAAQAASEGAHVIVAEIADHLGGTALLSTGNVWTVRDEQAFRRADPEGDAVLWAVVRGNLEESFKWLAKLRVAVRERHRSSSSSTYDPPPIGRNIDIETFLARARRVVEAAGGWILHGTTPTELTVSGGAVTGGRLRNVASGDEFEVQAKAVVLASGGFQASSALRAEYLGDRVGDSVAVRSNPHSQGTGLKLALRAGAATSRRMDTFYGVILPAVRGVLTEADYRGLVIHSVVYGVVLGLDGKRLTDESAGAVPLANAVARAGRAFLVLGPDALRESADRVGIDLTEMLRTAAERGARTATIDSLDGAVRKLARWGCDGTTALRTLTEYDELVTNGDSPRPARSRHQFPVGPGQVSLVEVRAAVTSTFGGIRTNGYGQVLRTNGSLMPGLFAAGIDQGGYNVAGYAGGLSRALVFGRLAAKAALHARQPLVNH